MTKMINTKKLEAFSGKAYGTLVSDDEFHSLVSAMNAETAAKREAAYEAAKASEREFGKYVVAEPFNCGGVQLQRGDVIYLSTIRGMGTVRVQRGKSRETVFATSTRKVVNAYAERLF